MPDNWRIGLPTDAAASADGTIIALLKRIRDLLGGTGSVRITDGTDIADVLDLASNNALAVGIVDGTGAQITSFGGGVQYTEGDTDASITGTALMWEDGSDTLRSVKTTKALPVTLYDTGGVELAVGGGTQYTEDVAAPGDPIGNAIMVTRDDQLATVTEAEGDWSRLRGTSKGALWVALADSSGDPIESFGGGTQYTEDAAAAANPVGTALNLIRADALAGVTTTDGDNVAARGTDKGELYVKHADSIAITHTALTELAGAIDTEMQVDVVTSALPSGASTSAKQDTIIGHVDGIEGLLTTIDGDTGTIAGAVSGTEMQVDVVTSALPSGASTAANQTTIIGHLDGVETLLGTIDTSLNNIEASESVLDDWDNAASDGASVSGDVAHDTADAGEPVKIGAKAESSPKGITLVADGDRTDLYADLDGIQLVKLATSNGDIISERVSNTDGASTAFSNFSAVANTRNYVTAYSAWNASATDGYIDIRDGTAGSILWTIPLPAAGGANLSSPVPLFRSSANTALAYDVSGALTTVYLSLSGFQSKA